MRLTNFLLMMAVLLLSGCATQKPVEKPVEKPVDYGYDFLGTDELNYHGYIYCRAFFEREGLLYFIQAKKPGSEFDVLIINPSLSIVSPRKRIYGNLRITDCAALGKYRNALFSQVHNASSWNSEVYVRVVIDEDLRTNLIKMASKNASNGDTAELVFRKLNGIASLSVNSHAHDLTRWALTYNVAGKGNRGKVSFDAIRNKMRYINPEEAKRALADVIEEIEYAKQKKIQEEERKKAAREKEAKRRAYDQKIWDTRLTLNWKKGDKACSYENHFGYVEEIHGQKLKVFVVGKANGSSGHFFSGNRGNFRYSDVESYRWFDRSEVSDCGFGG